MVVMYVAGVAYFMLIDMIMVFIYYWVWEELPQELLLTYIGVYGPWHGTRKLIIA